MICAAVNSSQPVVRVGESVASRNQRRGSRHQSFQDHTTLIGRGMLLPPCTLMQVLAEAVQYDLY